jgi:ADP-ribosylglycohydrolase
MAKIPNDYIERVYAGWLGKIIGIRHGSNIEGWTYERIQQVYGEITDYLFEFKNFAADDDSNGPVFFLRALQDYTHTRDITPEQIGLTWLNYAPYEHGFYWWGGYGKSTEHTAYLNLRSGIMAPRSGSVEQNGKTVAEQIGGQIFIDPWGLIAPGNPQLAAEYAEKAASVSHGGNGIYGGMFIAACISAAFLERDMEKIIDAGLSVIPEDCEYSFVARKVIDFYKNNPENWRDCFQYVKENYGYDKYPGNCHIIPNSAVIVLSLLYGEGDFSKTINICNMCGWDTDCNVGNAGTIAGVRNGLGGIDEKWRKPINDFLACSSVIGSLNILDLPWLAVYTADLGYQIAGEEPPAIWKEIMSEKGHRFHFELPGSTHVFRSKSDLSGTWDVKLQQTTEESRTGTGSLKVSAHLAVPKQANYETAGNTTDRQEGILVYHKTYYCPSDFSDNRYDPSCSPLLYPGQKIMGSIMIPSCKSTKDIKACLYVKDGNSGTVYESDPIGLQTEVWTELTYSIPPLSGACIEEAGIRIIPGSSNADTVTAYLDDFSFSGEPDYHLDFSKERMEKWGGLHREVSQFTYLKGIWELEDGELSGSCADFGEAYTGGYDWKDYRFEGTLIPKIGSHHNLNFRVQGAIRSYAAGLAPNNKFVLYKNDNGYKALAEVPFDWELNQEYRVKVEVYGSNIKIWSKDGLLIECKDDDHPYLSGQVGASVLHGSHCHYKDFVIKPTGTGY